MTINEAIKILYTTVRVPLFTEYGEETKFASEDVAIFADRISSIRSDTEGRAIITMSNKDEFFLNGSFAELVALLNMAWQ